MYGRMTNHVFFGSGRFLFSAGYSIAKKIRLTKAESNTTDKIVVIGMTSDKLTEHIEAKTCLSGMDTVWHKVFTTRELKGRVRDTIKQQQTASPIPLVECNSWIWGHKYLSSHIKVPQSLKSPYERHK